MDRDPFEPSPDGRPESEPVGRRLRYDVPHEMPPRPMFVRLGNDRPETDE